MRRAGAWWTPRGSRWPGPSSSGAWARAVTDGDGRFRLDAVPGRPITLAARDDEGRAAYAVAAPGQETVLVLKE